MYQIARAAILAVIGLTALNSAPANAQLPPMKMEAELVAAGNKPMSGPEIAKAMTGNTSYWLVVANNGTARPGMGGKTFHRDAKARVTVLNQGPDTGKKIEANWWIEGNTYCREDRVTAAFQHTCNSMFDVNSGFYLCYKPSNECRVFLRVMPGNPESL